MLKEVCANFHKSYVLLFISGAVNINIRENNGFVNIGDQQNVTFICHCGSGEFATYLFESCLQVRIYTLSIQLLL